MSLLAPFVDRFTRLLLRLRNRHFLLYDLLTFLVTPALALVLRTERLSPVDDYGSALAVVTGSFLVVKLGIFYAAGLYNRYWRYASIDELAKITLAVVAAVVAQSALYFFVLRPAGFVALEFPRSVPLLDGLLVLIFAGGARYSVRLAQRLQQRVRANGHNRRVLVVGAGEAGVLIAEEMYANPQLGLHPVAFVDDDPEKQRMRIRGLDVVGTSEAIPSLVPGLEIDLIVIAIARASGSDLRALSALCEETGVETKTIPGVYELLDERVTIRQLRDVQVEDLLRREPVEPDTTRVGALLDGKTVMVTGAGGSIGSELCRQILVLGPAALVLVGHGENSIFAIEAELRRRLAEHAAAGMPPVRLHAVIADIRDEDRMGHVFALHRPEVVFHAAAHKHVPLMEANAEDAVTNNVLGTRTLLQLCERYEADRFVLISTDKAVNPTSIMGATKRIAELLVQEAAARTGRAFSAVRFGNVLGSRGSVLQTFRRQLEHGGPLTVTHPEIKRFFMTIPEAVHLVLQAGALAEGGEVFLLEMGEPTRIVDLARDLIRLSSHKHSGEIEIIFTGLRPGEKLTEELAAEDEAFRPTVHEKILVCPRNGEAAVAAPALLEGVEALAEAAREGRLEHVPALIGALVPSYHAGPPEGDGLPEGPPAAAPASRRTAPS